MRRFLPIFLLVTAATAAGAVELPLKIFVSVAPQAWLVEGIGGDRVEVDVLVPPGASPASHEPTPRQLGRLSRARAWFLTGAPMERGLVPRADRHEGLEIIDTTVGIDLLRVAEHDSHHGHGHGEVDPHIWLSPRRMRAQAGIIAAALTRLDPDGAESYSESGAAIDSLLAEVESEIAAMLEPFSGREILVFHPSFGYLCADNGLRQVAVESGGMSPSPRHLTDVMEQARAAGTRSIFVQPQFSDTAARSVAAELGLDVVILDPLARDYPANIRRIAAALAAALGPAAPEPGATR